MRRVLGGTRGNRIIDTVLYSEVPYDFGRAFIGTVIVYRYSFYLSVGVFRKSAVYYIGSVYHAFVLGILIGYIDIGDFGVFDIVVSY